MRLRTLLVVVLILFCVRMSGRAPAAGPRPDRAPSGPQKVYPFSLRYRQQLEQQVRRPARSSPAVPAERPADDRPGRPAERAAFLPVGPALLSLLVRLQP